jgi:hypothetical protein
MNVTVNSKKMWNAEMKKNPVTLKTVLLVNLIGLIAIVLILWMSAV